MTASSIVVSVLVLNLHHHYPTTSVPPWLKRIAFDIIGRVLRVVTTQEPNHKKQQARSSLELNTTATPPANSHGPVGTAAPHHHPQTRLTRGNSTNTSPVSSLGLVVQGYCSEEDSEIGGRVEDNGVKRLRQIKTLTLSGGEDAFCESLKEIRHYLRILSERLTSQCLKDQVNDEWRLLAKVLDRFFLIFFVFSISALTVFILYVYPVVAGITGCKLLRKT